MRHKVKVGDIVKKGEREGRVIATKHYGRKMLSDRVKVNYGGVSDWECESHLDVIETMKKLKPRFAEIASSNNDE